MTKKIFRSIFACAIIVLAACCVLIMGVLYEYFSSVQEKQLDTELSLTVTAAEMGGIEYLKNVKNANCRLTLVGADGTVMYDSADDAEAMENHAEREEVKSAFETGYGNSVRYSNTLMEKTVYRAQKLSDGSVLRISESRAAVPLIVIGMLQPLIAIFVIALVISAAIAHRLSKRIVEPLNSIDLDKPLENNTYDELSPLLLHIERQQKKINLQKRELENKKNEFYTVIKNMDEGLVLLGSDSKIISINPAAESFFGQTDTVGKDFISVERNHDINKTLESAHKNGHAELEIERGEREYRLRASNIETDGNATGTVILIFDESDRVFAERNRREFTANVSHELKTPLQSIMGSAELIENGLVKKEDMPRFVGHIRTEAARLVTLIDDIIRLSQLDEGGKMPEEEVEVYSIAQENLSSLEGKAAEKHISLSIDGEHIVIHCVRRLLDEIIYNLCDNAIKYNKENGSVNVNVAREENRAVITVADTGIGIPQEHQSRVFERFYRVDKSHSKESGGTGLGLSIVKHAVMYLGGEITLTSKPGEGTTIKVFLPAAKA